ncbi:MAG: hypothetical protein LBM70_08790 [Victivallales bacterium]|jgi:hypothetical protein|nr:hypothetical protein [Victivallales bacterium]
MSSSVKKTKYRETVSRRGRERLQRAKRRFDICSGSLAILFIIAMMLCFYQKCELGSNQPTGFAMWFLLFFAYLPLELLGLLNWIFQAHNSTLTQFIVEQNPALGLGLLDLGMLAIIWVVIRFHCSRRYGVNWMRSASTFMTILALWGVFQLGCVALVLLWRGGGFSTLHRYLQHEPVPERVIIVGDATENSTDMRKWLEKKTSCTMLCRNAKSKGHSLWYL